MKFKHSGDAGDIIFALPTIKALGGGDLYLDPKGGEGQIYLKDTPTIKTKLTEEAILDLKVLLEQQPYIHNVYLWKGEKVDYNLDKFRTFSRPNTNVCEFHLNAFNLDSKLKDEQWLNIQESIKPNKPNVLIRTLRYHGNDSFYIFNKRQIEESFVFIGSPFEHEAFVRGLDINIEFQDIPSKFELAKVIAGAESIICNFGFGHTIAEGLKKSPIFLEYSRSTPISIFQRDGVTLV